MGKVKEANVFNQINECLKNITVEPVAFMFLVASSLAGLSSSNLALEKACRVNLNMSDAICDSIKNQDIDKDDVNEQIVQQYLARHLYWKNLMTFALPCILYPFVGGWMDKTGKRKWMMILPIAGEVVQNLSNILNVVFFYQLPVQVLLFFDAFFGSVFGAWSILFLAVFSFIADITTNENRTFRLGVVGFATYVGIPVGQSLSGIILNKFGYYIPYSAAMTMHFLNLLYVVFVIKDTKVVKEQIMNDERNNYNGVDNSFTEKDPLNEEPEVQEVEERSVCDKCLHVLRNTTVEPSMLLFIMAVMISLLTTQNVSLEKACRVNLNFTDEVCTSMKLQEKDNQNEFERSVQKLITKLTAQRTYLSATLPTIMALFVGSYSDKTGHRKLFLLVPVIGQLLLCISNIINVYFFDELKLEVLVFGEAILEGFSGGWCVLFLSAFSFVCAITNNEDRTYRMGLINFAMTVGFPVGMGVSGVLLKNGGYYAGYGTAAALHTINLIYTMFVLKDPERTKEQKKYDGRGLCYTLRIFFDLNHLKNTVKVVFKKTADNRRMRLIILLIVVCILFGPMYGEISILYLSTRYRFNWDEVKFSIFQTYNFILHTIGTIFSILVFSKYLKWHDAILGIISCVSKASAAFVYCFAPTGKLFFIAPAVDILGGTALLALRSIFTKSVAPDELGKINSIVGLCENLMPLIYVSLYTKIYTATMEVLPGAVFLLGAVLSIPAICVFIWLFIRFRRGLENPTKMEEANDLAMT